MVFTLKSLVSPYSFVERVVEPRLKDGQHIRWGISVLDKDTDVAIAVPGGEVMGRVKRIYRGVHEVHIPKQVEPAP